jgi:hypothetical protein
VPALSVVAAVVVVVLIIGWVFSSDIRTARRPLHEVAPR